MSEHVDDAKETPREFIPPPECPVFEPTEDEFADPLGYIAKIRPVAENFGICKIKPPPDWQPPFAVDVDNFKFTPRIQKLNELEANTRVKLNFLDALAKFWELQGLGMKIPNVERKTLDLYRLHRIVLEEGGYDMVSRERKWSRIADKMCYPPYKGVGSILRTHYEKILYPYDLFQAGATVDPIKVKNAIEEDEKKELKRDRDYKPGGSASSTPTKRTSSRLKKEEPQVELTGNKELRRLQFYGAGPKAAVPSGREEEVIPRMKMRNRTGALAANFMDNYICQSCSKGTDEEYMLLCDSCDDAFHTFCLVPPLNEIPKGDWRCPKCVAKECRKPREAFGFETSTHEYTLQTFGEQADNFKTDYFNMPVHMVACSTVEKEFWRLVETIDEDVYVEYGADIHSSNCGSGFPTKATKDQFPEDEEYIISGWNLNNLPVLDQSVLCHINANISGMKVPWCYVGMVFASFCWHIEDHWSYSINYLHWGEPKTWYGVPGNKADLFESVMKSQAPELFENQPDLLHQLTTILNPNVLTAHNVPVHRTNQQAGEFIITFPRSYHAGFNQGYNFAEAVNFAPADWLPLGRACIEHYRSLRRDCVFSHEELVCKMAADPDSLDLTLAASTHGEMLAMVDHEKKFRKTLLERGTTDAEREAFELLPDDERQCYYCKTTCFLSAVTCQCSPNRVVCIHHVDHLCDCHPSKHCLRYRYTLDELPSMLHRLKKRAEAFDTWVINVKRTLDADDSQKLDLIDLKELIVEADEKRFPDSELLQTLVTSTAEAEKCANVASQLLSKKVRTRNRQSGDTRYVAKLSMGELEAFIEQVNNLPCKIKEAALIQELLQKVTDFQTEAQTALDELMPDSDKLEKLVDFATTLDVDIPEIPKLKQVLGQAKWLDEVRRTVVEPNEVTLEVMRKLLDSGVSLAPHPAVEKAMAELQELLTVSERWEEKARICLQARPRHVITTLEAIINEAKGIPAYLPNISALKDAMKKARDWISKVDTIQNAEHYPYLDVLEVIVNKGRPIPVRLDTLPQIESQVAAAKSWRERTARTFLKKNSTYTLVEVLSPRNDIGVYNIGKKRKKKSIDGEVKQEDNGLSIKFEEHRDPASMVASFKDAEQNETDTMRALRARNMEKHRQDDNVDVRYCICRKGTSGFMLQCELCKDWFHGSCVPLPKSASLKNKSSLASAIQTAKDLKFMCPLCLRSRRPRLETILSLLVSLQKLPVRLPEGEALQCLTERAMAWQDRARQALATDELAAALAKLSVLSQRLIEQAAREKTERIINAELMKAASNPELQGHLQSVTQGAFSGLTTTISGIMSQGQSLLSQQNGAGDAEEAMADEDHEGNSDGEYTALDADAEAGPPTVMSSEHAYSTASKHSLGLGTPKKSPRKQPLVPRAAEPPVLELSDMAKAQLEELMMEGDLLEVSLDETQHIWRILQACQSKNHERFMEFEESELDIVKRELEKEKKKQKRKKKEMERSEDVQKENGIDKPKKKKIKKERDSHKVKSTEKRRRDGEKRKKKRMLDRQNSNREDDEDDEENCSAVKCLRPTGDEVNWVQCDKCEHWFHMICIGIAEEDISENEDFICFVCKRKINGEDIDSWNAPAILQRDVMQHIEEQLYSTDMADAVLDTIDSVVAHAVDVSKPEKEDGEVARLSESMDTEDQYVSVVSTPAESPTADKLNANQPGRSTLVQLLKEKPINVSGSGVNGTSTTSCTIDMKVPSSEVAVSNPT